MYVVVLVGTDATEVIQDFVRQASRTESAVSEVQAERNRENECLRKARELHCNENK